MFGIPAVSRFPYGWNKRDLIAHKYNLLVQTRFFWLLAQPVKLLRAGYGIRVRIRRAGKVGECAGDGGRGLQSETGVIEPCVIGWPFQNDIGSGRNDGQLRAERKAEHRATLRRPIKGVAR